MCLGALSAYQKIQIWGQVENRKNAGLGAWLPKSAALICASERNQNIDVFILPKHLAIRTGEQWHLCGQKRVGTNCASSSLPLFSRVRDRPGAYINHSRPSAWRAGLNSVQLLKWTEPTYRRFSSNAPHAKQLKSSRGISRAPISSRPPRWSGELKTAAPVKTLKKMNWNKSKYLIKTLKNSYKILIFKRFYDL